jgi:hypothetical protein
VFVWRWELECDIRDYRCSIKISNIQFTGRSVLTSERLYIKRPARKPELERYDSPLQTVRVTCRNSNIIWLSMMMKDLLHVIIINPHDVSSLTCLIELVIFFKNSNYKSFTEGFLGRKFNNCHTWKLIPCNICFTKDKIPDVTYCCWNCLCSFNKLTPLKSFVVMCTDIK